MKRIIYIVGVLVMLFSLSGCSLAEARLRELSRSSVSDSEAMKKVEDIVIQALETKDVELLKSIFSEKALLKASDFDRGVAYLFDLYQGNFVEIVEENHSAAEHIERNKSTKGIAAWCIIKTDKGIYKLSWEDMLVQEADPSAKGVYQIQMYEYIENNHHSFMEIAGINYPERDIAHKTLSDINAAFYDKERCFYIHTFNRVVKPRGNGQSG